MIYAPVLLKRDKEELLLSAELGTLQKLKIKRFNKPIVLDSFSSYFQYKNVLPLSITLLGCLLEEHNAFHSYQTQ